MDTARILVSPSVPPPAVGAAQAVLDDRAGSRLPRGWVVLPDLVEGWTTRSGPGHGPELVRSVTAPYERVRVVSTVGVDQWLLDVVLRVGRPMVGRLPTARLTLATGPRSMLVEPVEDHGPGLRVIGSAREPGSEHELFVSVDGEGASVRRVVDDEGAQLVLAVDVAHLVGERVGEAQRSLRVRLHAL